MNPSRNLFLIGPTGAGKSSLGRRLAAHYGLAFVDLDQVIEARCGAPIATIFELEGEAGFRRRERLALAEQASGEDVLLATGAGIVLDPANRDTLAARGFVVWVQATLKQQLERLTHDTRRPLLAVADRRARLETMARERLPHYQALAELALPPVGGMHAASAHCIELLDAHWRRARAA